MIPMRMIKANPVKKMSRTKGRLSLFKDVESPTETPAPQPRPLILRKMMCKLLLLCFPLYFSYLCFYSTVITPPPTPSPVKAAGGKKRAVADYESEEDVFVPR